MFVRLCGNDGDVSWRRRFCVMPAGHDGDHQYAEKIEGESGRDDSILVTHSGVTRRVHRDWNGHYHYLEMSS